MKDMISSARNKFNTLSINANGKKKNLIAAYVGLMGLSASTVPLWATTGSNGFKALADTIGRLFQQFYDAAKGIVSIIAIVLIGVCLILRIVSKNQRNVDEATAWAKRIVFTWVLFMFLGNIQSIIKGLGEDGGAQEVDFTA